MKFSIKFALCLFILSTSTAQAVITTTGDVDPADPSTWDLTVCAYVGKTSDGTLIVDGGSSLLSRFGFLGYELDATGLVTISGNDSSWEIDRQLLVGRSGTGQLNITDNAVVHVAEQTLLSGPDFSMVDAGDKGMGTIHFDSGTLHTNGLCAGTSELTGTGTIYTTCLLSDVDLLFDATHGMSQTITLDDLPDQNITIYLEQNALGYVTGAGYRGSGSLTINDGVTLESNMGYLGYHSGSSGTATVSGSGSTWTTGYFFSVGDRGNGVLNVMEGGTVTSGGTIGKEIGSSGTVNVSGTGSKWNASYVYVGNAGSGVLDVNNGGVVDNSGDSYIGYETGSTGQATVSGENSKWDMADCGEFDIGHYGTGELSISGGGYVINNWSNIGRYAGSTGSVTVSGRSASGTASRWITNKGLLVGKDGDGELSITDGGMVICNGIDYSSAIGYGANSTGTVTISGQNSSLRAFSALSIGYNGTGHLNITEGGLAWVGTNFRTATLGTLAGSTGTVLVSGAGSKWQGSIHVGDSGTGQFDIVDGGTVEGGGVVGVESGSNGTVNISGIGSTWNGSYLYIANHGTGRLNVTNGGVVNGEYFCICLNRNSEGTVNIDGVGSELKVENSSSDYAPIYVGNFGDGQLNITGGGNVSNNEGYLGYGAGATGTVTVSGSGSKWTSREEVRIGCEGIGQLNINDSGFVSNQTAFLGYGRSAIGTVNISGNGSSWENNNLFVGYYGAGNLVITDGGTVSNNFSELGYWSGSTGTVTVSGEAAKWTNNGSLFIGNEGDGQLNITDGGVVEVVGITYSGYKADGYGKIHFDSGTLRTKELYANTRDFTGSGAIYTEALVSDASLLFDATHSAQQIVTLNEPGQNIDIHLNQSSTRNLGVGYQSNASLTIRDGVTVECLNGYLGYRSGSSGVANISGTGTKWVNSESLGVGKEGRGELNITDGGQVGCSSCCLGYERGSMGIANVSGIGSTWNASSGGIMVGLYGNGQLDIVNGGVVNCQGTSIGFMEGATGVVTVSGSGSTWTQQQSGGSYTGLYVVGNYGSGELVITNGGTVNNQSCKIADNLGSTGIVTVNGHGSTWNNNIRLEVGCYGTGTLNITNGGTVNSPAGSIAYWNEGVGSVTVSGIGSKWATTSLKVGLSGAGELHIVDGGLVSVAYGLTIDEDGDNDSFIKISEGGMLALAGEADDSLDDFFGLIEGVDDIRWWNMWNNDWEPLTTARPGQCYRLEYLTEGDLAGYTLLTVDTLVPGDANGDGRVDGSDVTILASNWQRGTLEAIETTWQMGDFNGDGKVDGSDVTILAGNWQYGVANAAAAVPEPGGIALMLATLLTMVGGSILKRGDRK